MEHDGAEEWSGLQHAEQIVRSLYERALQSIASCGDYAVGTASALIGSQEVGVRLVTAADSRAASLEVVITGQQQEADVRLVDAARRVFRGVPHEAWQTVPCSIGFTFAANLDVKSLPNVLSLPEADSRAHIVFGRNLPDGLVYQHPTRALCGHVYVPTVVGSAAHDREQCTLCHIVRALAVAIYGRFQEVARTDD